MVKYINVEKLGHSIIDACKESGMAPLKVEDFLIELGNILNKGMAEFKEGSGKNETEL